MKLWESKCNLLNVLVYSVIVLAQQGSDIWRNKEKESVQQTPTHSLAHLLSNMQTSLLCRQRLCSF